MTILPCFDRRTLIGCMAATVANAMAPAFAVGKDRLQTWKSKDGLVALAYDPEIWELLDGARAGFDEVYIATDLADDRKRYWLRVAKSTVSWRSIDEAQTRAIGAWYVKGMGHSVITEEFSTDTAYGWIAWADSKDGIRTVNVFQYILVDGAWYEAFLSIDAGGSAKTPIDVVVDAVSLNGGPLFIIAPRQTIIRAVEAAFAA